MSYLALYRKYRPSNFDDLVGQSEIANIIKNEILNNKISHAYLFSGPRGTGKTSTAKIIARMINCSNLSKDGVPCGECSSCLNFDSNSDIVEIDAASNNGVDEIRELRDKVNLVPTFGKYKIYIIDVVHMLTTQAFNALLKTLEEPPSHVVFILATTEFYKIPVTVVSRCQKFQFLKFTNDDIVSRLENICDLEKIDIEKDALYEVARLSDGGLRDAINMLDQLSSFKDTKLNVDDVYKLSGVISYSEFYELFKFISKNKVVKIVDFIENIDKKGKNFNRFIEDLLDFLKDVLVFKNSSESLGISDKREVISGVSELYSMEDIYEFIMNLNDLSIRIKNTSFIKVLLVTEFIKMSNKFSENKVEKALKSENKVKSTNEIQDKKIDSVVNSSVMVSNLSTISDKNKKIRINNAFATASKDLKKNFVNNWTNVLNKVSNDTNYLAIAGIINDVDVLVVGESNVLFLANYDSLLERLFVHLDKFEKLLLDVFLKEYKVMFLLKDEWDYEMKKYISNTKSGVKYQYIEEDSSDSDKKDDVDEDISKVISLLGNDVISYE